MGRIYSVSWNGDIAAADGNVDLLEISPASNKPCRLRGWSIGQTSEVKDAEEEGYRITVTHVPATATSGSGGATTTVGKTSETMATQGFTAEGRNTTVATTSGSLIVKGEFAWINRNTPWEFFYPSAEFCPECINGTFIVVRFESTVADTISCACTFWVEEEG